MNIAGFLKELDRLEWFLYLLEFRLNAMALGCRRYGRRKG